MSIRHSTQADNSFTPQGKAAWDAAHTGDASDIDFLQSGAAAVTRTTQNKLREIVSITDFGAIGDGATNDTAAIAAAISALPSTGGVLIAPGQQSGMRTYITDTIIFPDYPKHIAIIGDSQNSVTFQALTTNKPIFQGAANIVATVGTARNLVYGITLKAHASGSTGAAVDMRKMDHTKFREIGFALNGSGKWTYGFLMDGTNACYNNEIDGVEINNTSPITTALIRIANVANLQNIKRLKLVAVAIPSVISFDNSGTNAVFISECYFEGLTTISPSVIDVGTGNGNIFVKNCYFEDCVKAFDETKTSECYIDTCYFSASPGASQGSALGVNYKRINNPSGGTNVSNAIAGRLDILGAGSNSDIRHYKSDNGSFVTWTFDGVKESINFPFQTTSGDITATTGRVAGAIGASATTAPAVVMPSVITTAVGNVGGGEDVLQLYALPANSFSAAGKGVHVVQSGTIANNANPKTLKSYFGTVAIVTQALTVAIAGTWRVEFDVVSTGSSTQDYAGLLTYQGAAGVTISTPFHGTLTQTQTNALNIACTGTVTDGGGGINNNDIVQEYQRTDFFG